MGRMHALLSIHLHGPPDGGTLATQGRTVPLPSVTSTHRNSLLSCTRTPCNYRTSHFLKEQNPIIPCLDPQLPLVTIPEDEIWEKKAGVSDC